MRKKGVMKGIVDIELPEYTEREKESARMALEMMFEKVYGETAEELTARLELKQQKDMEQDRLRIMGKLFDERDVSVKQVAMIMDMTEEEVLDMQSKFQTMRKVYKGKIFGVIYMDVHYSVLYGERVADMKERLEQEKEVAVEKMIINMLNTKKFGLSPRKISIIAGVREQRVSDIQRRISEN